MALRAPHRTQIEPSYGAPGKLGGGGRHDLSTTETAERDLVGKHPSVKGWSPT